MTDDAAHPWALGGDPARLTAAAAALRAGSAERVFGSRQPGEYVMAATARLLDTLAARMREGGDVGHDVVSAAAEIAEHILDRLPAPGQAAPGVGGAGME